jgi:hypothetical protein
MKHNSILNPVLFLLLTFLAAGCNLPATATPAPTKTPRPADTSTPVPTKTLKPINTPKPVPTVIPADLVWFAPNMGSTDYTELFTKPQ